MGQDSTKVLLGTTRSSFKVVDNKPGTLEAGVVACAKSDGTYTTAAADGADVGVSLGKSLSDTDRFALVREGTEVPILKGSGTPVVGEQVAVSDTTGKTVDFTGSGDRKINAYYTEVGLTGIKEDGTEADVSIIDFPGGL